MGFVLFSCDNNKEVKAAAQAELQANDNSDGGGDVDAKKSQIEEMRTQVLAEDDYIGRMEKGLSTLRQYYQLSEEAMPDLGKITIDLTEKLDLTIINELNGDVIETKVNLLNLNTADGGFRLIPDKNLGDFPGLRVKTINDEPLVLVYKNGKLVNKNNELVIFLKDRESIEKITPAVLQTLRVAKEMKEQE